MSLIGLLGGGGTSDLPVATAGYAPVAAKLYDINNKMLAVLEPNRRYVIGRENPADIIVGADNPEISPQYCALEYVNGLWLFTDTSLNGTVLNIGLDLNNISHSTAFAIGAERTSAGKIIWIKGNQVTMYNVGGFRTDFERRVAGSSVPIPANTVTDIHLNGKLKASEPTAYGSIVNIIGDRSVELRLEIPKSE